MVPLRIAVISSEQAAGYQDFMHQLTNNEYVFAFQVTTFNATMQGKDAEPSILRALESVFNSLEEFDAVVIIRGGGAQADLSCFDSYWLAFHIAQFPLPIITGIGHTKDISICDMVSNTSVKTPTAAAELLISKVAEFDSTLTELANTISETVENFIEERLHQLKQAFRKVAGISTTIYQQQKSLDFYAHSLKNQLNRSIIQHDRMLIHAIKTLQNRPIALIQRKKGNSEKYKTALKHNLHALVSSENKVITANELVFRNLHPDNILKRGYSITRIDGKAIKSIETIHAGQIIETTFASGVINSEIIASPELPRLDSY